MPHMGGSLFADWQQIWTGAWRGAVMGAVVGLLAGVVLWLIRRRKGDDDSSS